MQNRVGSSSRKLLARSFTSIVALAIAAFSLAVMVGSSTANADEAGSNYAAYLASPETIPSAEVLALFQSHHVVIVAGYANAMINLKARVARDPQLKYGNVNVELLRSMGITTSIHYPRSLETIDASAEELAERLPELHREGGGKPLFLVGHSRGGPVVLTAIANRIDLLESGKVRKITTIQGLVSGRTKLAAREWLVARLWPLGNVGFLGLKALEPSSVEAAVGRAFAKLTPGQKELLHQATLYFTTSKRAETRSEKTGSIRFDKKTLNDTLLPTAAMHRAGAGANQFGRLADYNPQVGHLDPIIVDPELPRETALARIRAYMFGFMDSVARNMLGTENDANRTSAATRVAIDKASRNYARTSMTRRARASLAACEGSFITIRN